MNHFVVDASVSVAWCFQEEATRHTEEALEALRTGWEAVVPPLWPYEVSNVLLGALRRNRLTPTQAASLLQKMQSLPITVDSESLGRVFNEVLAVAEEYGLTTYDAAYLELAMRKGLPLATLDRDLRRAARAVGVRTALGS